MKIAFAGTPEFAAVALKNILEAGFDVSLVLTQPDRPAGRGMKLAQSAVKKLALQHGLQLDQPERLRSEDERASLRACAPDVLVVAAYGLLLPQAVLDLPKYGCVNIHASLLPRWRGAAPIHRAVEAGDAETGITIMQMDAGLDTGKMLLRESLPIGAHDTTGSLHDALAQLGGKMIVQALKDLARGELPGTIQPQEGVTYAHKIKKAEAHICWQSPAAEIERKIRAFDPFPGAVSQINGVPLKFFGARVRESARDVPSGTVLEVSPQGIVVACGFQALSLEVLQKPGGKRQDVASFVAGFLIKPGDCFENPVENL